MDMSQNIAPVDPHHPDAAILTDYAAWQSTWAAQKRLDDKDEEAREQSWDVICKAENRLQKAVARTVPGVTAQLWVALTQDLAGDEEDAAVAGNIDHLKDAPVDGWKNQLIVSALRGLTAMAAADEASATALDAAIAHYEALRAEARNYHDTVYCPACDALRAALKAVPHYTTERSFFNISGATMHLTTEEHTVKVARDFLEKPYDTDAEYVACLKELVSAADRRDAEIAHLRDEAGLEAIERRSDELFALSDAPYDAVVEFPVRTIGELLRKVEYLRKCEDALPDDVLVADLQRIAGVGQ